MQATLQVIIALSVSLRRLSPVTTDNASYVDVSWLSVNTGAADFLWYITCNAVILVQILAVIGMLCTHRNGGNMVKTN